MKLKWLSTTLVLLAALESFALATPQENEKSELRVLFVGQNPENPKVPFPGLATERTHELFRERTGAFDKFLNEHFESVRIVHGEDYDSGMSDEVDVTVFDALVSENKLNPPALGGIAALGYGGTQHLAPDFDRPALMISHISARLGEDMGLKLDWL